MITTVREREFPIVADYTYLNTATQGPLPTSTRRAIEQAAQNAQFPGLTQAPGQEMVAETVRNQLADLLNAHADDFVFLGNTTGGLNLCAQGIAWQPGDNVVLPANEFPSVMATWLNLRAIGVEVRLVAWSGAGPYVDQLMAAVDSHTRVVACSAVAWDTGYLIDLETLGRRCAAAGCLLIVDGIQAVGAFDLDLRAMGVAALSFHGYKWLLADFGVGMLYVAPAAIDQIRPIMVGEQSVLEASLEQASQTPDHPLAWKPGARRYTVGGYNMLGLTALAASLELIRSVGMPTITQHNRSMAEYLVQELQRIPEITLVSSRDPARRSVITVFTFGSKEHDAAMVQRLGEQHILVAHRRRGIRVSPHWFNTVEEIERLLRALRGG
jgi:cysteine desulfurase / selenocysteine lyase